MILLLILILIVFMLLAIPPLLTEYPLKVIIFSGKAHKNAVILVQEIGLDTAGPVVSAVLLNFIIAVFREYQMRGFQEGTGAVPLAWNKSVYMENFAGICGSIRFAVPLFGVDVYFFWIYPKQIRHILFDQRIIIIGHHVVDPLLVTVKANSV